MNSISKNKNETELAWTILSDLRNAENHFNDTIVKHRLLASTWLLATFAAIGFLIKADINIKVPVELIIMGLAVACSLGVLLLWNLDFLVYRRLLDACFKEGLEIEKAYPHLPQVRNQMRLSQPKGEVVGRAQWFYIGLVNSPLVFIGPIFSYWLRQFGYWSTILSGVIIISVILFLSFFIIRKSASLKPEHTPLPQTKFQTKKLGDDVDSLAPDGSEIRLLNRLMGGSMVHCTLAPGKISTPVTHISVEEIWYCIEGKGKLWRKQGDSEKVVGVEPGISVTIPQGTQFQFKNIGQTQLRIIIVTMPPWPGKYEAIKVTGKW